MKNSWKTSVVAALAFTFAASLSVPAAWADAERGKLPPKHDSNTLHKLGNAIQYPVRKLGENTSVATHEATGKKSVVPDKKNKMVEVVTPGGNKIVKKSYYGHRYAHRHHRHARRHHRSM